MLTLQACSASPLGSRRLCPNGDKSTEVFQVPWLPLRASAHWIACGYGRVFLTARWQHDARLSWRSSPHSNSSRSMPLSSIGPLSLCQPNWERSTLFTSLPHCSGKRQPALISSWQRTTAPSHWARKRMASVCWGHRESQQRLAALIEREKPYPQSIKSLPA